MNSKILIAPQKYIQGAGALNELGKWSKNYGKNVYVIIDDFVKIAGEKIPNVGKKEGLNIILAKFNGECSQKEIDKHIKIAEKNSVSVFVGVGGGKTLDTTKAAAHIANKPVIICPTLASTAPTSALAIIYTPTGEFERYMHLPFNPNIVLVDTELIVQAPHRLLSSGIGDALSTYYEAKVCVEADATNMAGGLSTKAAYALATLCKDVLYKYGVQALKDCKEKRITPAFEAIVEANILLSGLGFESSGLAAAHSIHDGLTELEETHHFTHGEKVAFGTVTQAVIDNDLKALDDIVKLCVSVNLPVTLKDLGIVADKTVHKDETIHSYLYKMTSDIVYNAILKADKLATEIKKAL